MWRLARAAKQSFFVISGVLAACNISWAAACLSSATPVSTTPVIEQSPARLAKAREQTKIRGNPDVVIIGDSIAANWAKTQQEDFSGFSVLNLGIGGEKTQELRWRISESLPFINPRHVILITGTNNLFDQSVSPCEIIEALKLIQSDLKRTWPSAEIFSFPLLPRGREFRFREDARKVVNDALYNSPPTTRSVRVDEETLTCNWSLRSCSNYRPDNVHLGEAGYVILRQNLQDSGFGR